MPPRKAKAPQPEPEPSQSESEPEQLAPEPAQEAPAPRKGGDIHAARMKALEKLRERSEVKKKEAELKKVQEQTRKELVEAELLKQRRDLEDIRKMKAQMAEAPKSKAKPKKKAPPPPSSSEEDTESEEEDAPPATTKKRLGRALPSTRQLQDYEVKKAYEQRLEQLRRSLLSQAFGN